MLISTGLASVPFLPSTPALSFYELRVASQVLVAPCFQELGEGWWRYETGGLRADMYRPSWDRAYDWDEAHAQGRARAKRPWWVSL